MEMPHYTPSDHVMYVKWGRGTTKWLAIFELGFWVTLLQRNDGPPLSD